MHIRLDAGNLTLDDLEALEGAKFDPTKGTWRQVREVLARFCFESDAEDAEKMEYNEALKVCGSITLENITKIMGTVKSMMEDIGASAVPPTQSDKSSSPSED